MTPSSLFGFSQLPVRCICDYTRKSSKFNGVQVIFLEMVKRFCWTVNKISGALLSRTAFESVKLVTFYRLVWAVPTRTTNLTRANNTQDNRGRGTPLVRRHYVSLQNKIFTSSANTGFLCLERQNGLAKLLQLLRYIRLE